MINKNMINKNIILKVIPYLYPIESFILLSTSSLFSDILCKFIEDYYVFYPIHSRIQNWIHNFNINYLVRRNLYGKVRHTKHIIN